LISDRRILHPHSEEGVPSDLLTRHLFATSDWMGVWSRTGLVVAFKVGVGKDAAMRAQARFREIVQLARSIHQCFNSGRDGEHVELRIERSDELTRKAAKLRYELILPENRLISQFFDAINLSELLQTMRDMLLGLNSHTTAEVQTKVEWLEVFIVGFYGTELASSAVEKLEIPHIWSLLTIVIAGSLFTGLTAYLLKPWQHGRSTNLKWLLYLVFFTYALAACAAVIRHFDKLGDIFHR
jgi:hypothetical protein